MRHDRAALPSPLALIAGTFALVSGLLGAGALRAADGAPDETFDDDGVQIIGWGGHIAPATAVAALADGSLIVGGTVLDTGSDEDFALTKLTPAGGLDLLWGNLGRRIVPIDSAVDWNDDILKEIAVLADGSFLVAGLNQADLSLNEPKIALTRLTPEGDVDETFGEDGVSVVEVPFGADTWRFDRVLHQPDGKILYLGNCTLCPDDTPLARPFLLRLTTAGELDESFSGDGLVLAPSPPWSESWPWAIALDGAGRIFVLSQAFAQLFVARLTPAGQLDTTFGGGLGYVAVARPTGALDPAQLTIDPASGAMFISYRIDSGPNDGLSGVIRLQANGVVDPTFGGGDGEAVLAYEDPVTLQAAHLQSDGKLVLAGFATHAPNDRDPILFRLLPNGTLDDSFDLNGVATIDFHQGAGNDEVTTAFVFAGGRPVVVGSVPVSNTPRFGIARLTSTLIFTDGFESGSLASWPGN